MIPTSRRHCPWLLCLCGRCDCVPRVKRVKRVPLRGELVDMTPAQYARYREALQAKAWGALTG